MFEKNYINEYKNRVAAFSACFEKHLAAGVVFLSSDGILIDDEVQIEPGATILPGTILRGNTFIKKGCVIGPNTLLENTIVMENAVVNASQCYNSVIKNDASVGPFSHLRAGSEIGEKAHIGDFVETKNCTIGAGTSVSHLTYVGDADVGKGCNLGCGVVFTNYDGVNKHRTVVGDYAFIGCNTNLVPPVRVGNGAYTAAGSTITKNVPDFALAIERGTQVNKENWAKEKLKPYEEKKKKVLMGD